MSRCILINSYYYKFFERKKRIINFLLNINYNKNFLLNLITRLKQERHMKLTYIYQLVPVMTISSPWKHLNDKQLNLIVTTFFCGITYYYVKLHHTKIYVIYVICATVGSTHRTESENTQCFQCTVDFTV